MSYDIEGVERYINEMLSGSVPLTQTERQHDFTPVEIVNEREIYLLKQNPDYNPEVPTSPAYIRDRRICGALRERKRNSRLRCLLTPGHGTNHLGVGYCKVHEQIVNNAIASRTRFRVLQGYEASGFALRLKELHSKIPDLLDDPKLGDVSEEIVIQEEILKLKMEAAPKDLTLLNSIEDTLQNLARLKTARQKILADRLLMDTNSVRLFIAAILDVCKRNLSFAQYSKLAEELMSLPVPINRSMQILFNTTPEGPN